MQNFQQLDQRRAAAKVTRKALYERAGVHKETWRRLATGRTLGTVKTFQKLTAALDELEKGRGNGTDHQ